jgi:hypothetical protein
VVFVEVTVVVRVIDIEFEGVLVGLTEGVLVNELVFVGVIEDVLVDVSVVILVIEYSVVIVVDSV